MTWSEDSLHQWLDARQKPSPMVGSLGHDGAVLRESKGRTVLCTDACIEGVHFLPSAKAGDVGYKAVARCLSDLAACGATPRALLLALRAPVTAKESQLRALITGVLNAGDACNAPLVGGDTSCAPGPIALTITALGTLAGRRRPVGRDRAKPGQVVLLTGPVGGSLLGRHLKIVPRLDEGKFLFDAGATVLMDVSDGLAIDMGRIARASGVSVHLEHVPIHPDAKRQAKRSGKSAIEHALLDGEDHELIVCIGRKEWRACQTRVQRRFPRLQVVGRIGKETGLLLDLPESVSLPANAATLGWIHGSR